MVGDANGDGVAGTAEAGTATAVDGGGVAESGGVAEGGCSDRQPVNNTVNIPVKIAANLAKAKAGAPGSLIETAHGGVYVLFRQAGGRRNRLPYRFVDGLLLFV